MSEEALKEGLKIHYLPDEHAPISDKGTFLAIMDKMKSNGGDGRCLCSGCIAFWALRHLQSVA